MSEQDTPTEQLRGCLPKVYGAASDLRFEAAYIASIQGSMMKKLILVAAMLGLGGQAQAATFVLNYTFDTGEKIAASFDGTLNNGLVSGLSNVSVKVNGTSFTGPLYAYSNNATRGDGQRCGAPSCFGDQAVASSDPLRNNFLISNSSNLAQSSGTNYFYMFPWSSAPTGIGVQALFNGSLIDPNNEQFRTTQAYSLQQVTSGVLPEPATWAMMIGGFGMVGGSMRYRRRKTRVTFATA